MKLFLLFAIMPFVELVILFRISDYIGNLKARKLVHKIHKGLSSTPLPPRVLVAPSFTPGIMFSDHINYYDNIPSVMITDTAFYRNPNYHKSTDTPETLDYERMGLIVKGTYLAIVDVAQ